MNWATVAILNAVILALVNIVDSHLITRRMPGIRSFLLPVGVVHLSYGLLVFFLFPFPEDIGIKIVLVAIASGIIRGVAVLIMVYSLAKEEVSRVIPVVYTYPILSEIIPNQPF